jgi:hypothetical protein
MAINLIEYILKETELRQKDLAVGLGVSAAQISRWKVGEAIPHGRRSELKELAGLFSDDGEWLALARTELNAKRWIKYIETRSMLLECDIDILDAEPFDTAPIILTRIAASGIPLGDAPSPPSGDGLSDEEFEDVIESYTQSAIENLIDQVLTDFSYLYRWHSRYINSQDLDDDFDIILDLVWMGLELAICNVDEKCLEKVGVDITEFRQFRSRVRKETKDLIGNFCNAMVARGLPLMVDYYHYVESNPEELDDEVLFSRHMGILQHMSYFEKEQMLHSKLILASLKELHMKLDVLLPEEHRDGLSEYVKYMRPNLNPYLYPEE